MGEHRIGSPARITSWVALSETQNPSGPPSSSLGRAAQKPSSLRSPPGPVPGHVGTLKGVLRDLVHTHCSSKCVLTAASCQALRYMPLLHPT